MSHKLLVTSIKKCDNTDDVITVLHQLGLQRYCNYALLLATRFGKDNLVKKLLKLPSVDPSTSNNDALINACINCKLETVKSFLTKTNIAKGVDPAAQNNTPLLVSSDNKDLIDYLLTFDRVDLTAQNNSIIYQVCIYGNSECLEFVLQQYISKQIDMHSFINEVLYQVCSMGKISLVIVLLSPMMYDQGIDPKSNSYDSFMKLGTSCEDVFFAFITHPKFYPTADDEIEDLPEHVQTKMEEMLASIKVKKAKGNR